MANEAYTRTNQALFFARKAIESWQQAESSNALDSLTQAQYHREHAVFHLYRGALALIHEVADRYRWPLVDARQVEAVLVPSVVQRFPGPELAELTELADSKGTWLAGVIGAWQRLQAPPVPADSKAESLIASSAVATAEWSCADAQEALQALSERVAAYRDGMQEW